MVQQAVHEIQRGKQMINEVRVHEGSSKVLLPYDMLKHYCVSKNKQKLKPQERCVHLNAKH